jgi:hypothetical protein
MSAASKHEVIQLTPTTRLALYMVTYSKAQLLGRPIVVFTVHVLIGGVILNNEPFANVFNVVKSRRDYVVWRKGIHTILCCEHPIKYNYLEREKRN